MLKLKIQLFDKLRGTLFGRVLVNAGWIIAITPIDMLLGLIRVAILARMLGPDSFGVLAILTATIKVCDGSFRLTSAETLMSFVNKRLTEKDVAGAAGLVRYCYLADLSSSFVACGVVQTVAWLLSDLFGISAEMRGMLSLLGVSIIFRSTALVSRSILRIGDRFKWEFYLMTISSFLLTLGIVILYLLQFSELKYVVWLMATTAVFDGVMAYLLAKLIIPGLGFNRPIRISSIKAATNKEVLRFQFLSSARRIIKSINQNVDVLLVGSLVTSTEVGLYRASKQLTDLLRSVTAGVTTSLYPEYSRLFFSRELLLLRKLVKRLTIGFTVLSVTACIILAVAVDWMIQLILGAEFLPARSTIRILLLSSFLYVSMTPLYSLPTSVGKAGPALQAMVVALVTQALLIWILVPEGGATGAAWSTVGSAVIWVLVLLPRAVAVLRRVDSKNAA